MTPDLDRLEAIARKATPGPWSRVDPPWGDSDWVCSGSGDPHSGVFIADCESDIDDDGIEGLPDAADDAAHIAAFDPSMALALIGELRQRRLAALEQAGVETWRAGRNAAVDELHRIANYYADAKNVWAQDLMTRAAITVATLAPAPVAPAPVAQEAVLPRQGLTLIGDRLECVKCHEVEMWCQCDPWPFAQAGDKAESWQGYSNPEDSAAMFMDWCALHGFGLAGWPPGACKQICAHLAAAERKGAEAAIRVIEGGSFLHDDAPGARFAREVVAAIRRELALQPPAGAL